MIRSLQEQGATREDIIAFIKKSKIKPLLPDDAPIAVVLFAGGGGIEAGMVQAGIRPVIAV